MKSLVILGALLMGLGVAAMFIGHVSWTETKPIARLGPLEINSQHNRTIWIPTAAGLAAVLAGAGLVLAGKRSI
jgi:hypothetical protein